MPEAMNATAQQDAKAWAHRIMERHKRGEKVNPAVLAMARRALGMPTEK